MKPKKIKVPQTNEDLIKSLQDCVSNLISLCKSYDDGDKFVGKLIATVLRNLFHHTAPNGGTSHSLLQQLSLRDHDWIAMEAPVPVFQGIDTCIIIYWNFNKKTNSTEPNFSMYPSNTKKYFSNWWKDPVANSLKYGSYSREEIVLGIANQEGAHTDLALEAKYIALKNGSFISNLKAISNTNANYIQDVHYACIRQIAHEVLITLKEICPKAFSTEYIYKTKLELLNIEHDKDVLNDFSDNPDKLNDYGVFIQNNFRDANRAMIFYTCALEIKPDHVNALGNSALIYEKQKKYDHAEIFYKRALDVNSKHENNLANYALFLARVRNSVDADYYFKEVLKLNKAQHTALKNYPVFLAYIKKDLTSAEYYYQLALESYPHDANTLNNYGVFLEQFKTDYEQAEIMYKKALELAPDHHDALNNYKQLLKIKSEQDKK